jgi:hypothetical protein
MRKYQRQQILDILQSLREVQKAGLYADCQDGALGCVDFIDEIMGEGTKTVEFLKEYCELLFRVHNGEANKDVLRKSLRQVENSAQNELKSDKIEVVFFPYKASMFDSLESIYLAAKDDPDCDAYVVPIPGYELNPDGSFGKMYYDGGEYPENIPVTDWREYDVDARQPDVIFTHYPYDDNASNYTIHPNFYSKRLRECCERLICVPYAVWPGQSIIGFEAALPSVVFAHHVITESEAVRKSFVGHYKNFDKQLGWNGRFGEAEDKFIALGSPKYDKIINTKLEDYKLPTKWERLIFRADGSRRKIVLYNTHMWQWLGGGSAYFKKLRSVFDTFRNNDDVVLWWRPHPNTELNFRSKRPDLLGEYLKIIEEYKVADFGVYDDTHGLHRAIAWSNAYYGDDNSSLIALYRATEKPMLFQDVAIRPDNPNCNHLTFWNLCNDSEYFWFTPYGFNALFKMNKQTWKMEYTRSFPSEKIDRFLYGKFAEHNEKLYFSPYEASEIAVYDINLKKFQKIKINENVIANNAKFYHIETYDKYVFFIGHRYPAIVRYDTETEELYYFTDWLKPLEKMSNSDGFYFSDGCIFDDRLFLPFLGANVIVEFNMNTCISKNHRIGRDDNTYHNICFDGNDFWITTRKNKTVVKWSPKTGKYKEYRDFTVGFVGGNNSDFVGVAYLDGYVWLFPYEANMALKIDVKTEEITIAEEFQEICNAKKEKAFDFNYVLSKVIDDKIYACTGKSVKLIEYDSTTKSLREEGIVPDKECIDKVKQCYSERICEDSSCLIGIAENPFFKLQNFFEYISIETRENTTETTNVTVGESIYDYAKGLLK